MKTFIFLSISLISTIVVAKSSTSSRNCNTEFPGQVQLGQIKEIYDKCNPAPDIAELHKFQMIMTSETLQIQDMAPQVFRFDASFIRDRTENQGLVTLFYDLTTNILDSGNWKTYNSNPIIQTETIQSSRLKRVLNLQSTKQSKFYNLKVSTGWMETPPDVAKQVDCGGLSQCEDGIRYFKMAFERHILPSGNEGLRILKYEFISSPDVPSYLGGFAESGGGEVYLSKDLKVCTEEMASNNNPHTMTCFQLDNFHL